MNEISENESSFLGTFVSTYSTIPLHGITAIPGKIGQCTGQCNEFSVFAPSFIRSLVHMLHQSLDPLGDLMPCLSSSTSTYF